MSLDLVTIDLADEELHTDLMVHRVLLREEFSRPSTCALTLSTTQDPEHLVERLLDRSVNVRLRALRQDGPDRVLQGDVTQASSHDTTEGSRRIDILVEAPLWRLRRRLNSRVFQGASIPVIIGTFLAEHDIPHDFRLTEEYAPREYTVQYQETDEEIVRRLLGECGMFMFTATDGTLVIADAATAYIRADFPLVSRPGAEDSALNADEHAVFSLDMRRSARPHSVVARRQDEERAGSTFESTARASSATSINYETQALTSLSESDPELRNEVDPNTLYIHRAQSVSSPARQHNAAVLLEQHRQDLHVGHAAGNSDRLAPGVVIRLTEHDAASLNADYVVVKVSTELSPASDGPACSTQFSAAPSAVAWRVPPQPSRRLNVLETATVVGPPGSRVHTDPLGRVKIRFHWERSTRDAYGSCWVRPVQPWAGVGRGTTFVPRVGDEVAVAFLGGDPDRPVILGSLFGGEATPPTRLPDEALLTGLRSASIDPSTGRASGGASHLLFDDTFEHESVSLRSQHDLTQEILGSLTSRVGQSQHLSISGESSVSVGANSSLRVSGQHHLAVDGNLATQVGGNLVRNIRGSGQLSYEGAITLSSSDYSQFSNEVSIQSRRTYVVASDPDDKRVSNFSLAEGSLAAFGSKSVLLKSDESITLSVGTTSVTLGPEKVSISADTLELVGRSATTLIGATSGLDLRDGVSFSGEKVTVASAGASLVLDANAHLDGALVLLNCGGSSAETPVGADPDDSTRPLRISLHEPHGLPLNNWAYRLTGPGVLRTGKTTALGLLEEKLPEAIGYVELVATHPETGERRSWKIQVEPLPPLPSLEGILVRLSNLGFYPPTLSLPAHAAPERTEVDAALPYDVHLSLLQFQRAAGLDETGLLDGTTLAALNAFGATPT